MDKHGQPVELTQADADAALDSSLAILHGMSEGDDEQVAKFEAQVVEAMEKAQKRADPRGQLYIKRLDKNTVIKSQEEYERCEKAKVPMGTVTLGQAMASVREEEFVLKKLRVRKQKRKTAKASRKRNRS